MIFFGVYVLLFEYVGCVDVYIDEVCDCMLLMLVDEGFVDVVDVFCECIGFLFV